MRTSSLRLMTGSAALMMMAAIAAGASPGADRTQSANTAQPASEATGQPQGQPQDQRINKPMLAQAADAVPAQWTRKKYSFFYQGFTSHYTCDGLRDQVEDALRKLGARRSDLKVRETGCAGSPDRPSPFPGTDIEMSVLVPAKDAPANETVQAHWKTVDLKLNNNRRNDPGTCELIDEITKKIVPLFTARNVESRATCIPHQLSGAQEPTLKLDVLSAATDTDKR